MHIAGEFDSGIAFVLLLHRLHVAGGLGMVSATHHQPGIRQSMGNIAEGFGHQLQALVSSPLAEGEDAMFGIAAAGHVGKLGLAGKNAVRPQMDVIASVFFVENLPVSRHEDGNGIRQKEQPGGQSAGQTIGARMANAGIFQIHGVHEVMQRHMGIASAEARQQRSEESGKGDQGIAAEGAEQQVEPNHVRLDFADGLQDVGSAGRVVEGPAALHGKALDFGVSLGDFVGENGQADEGIALQFLRDVKPVFAESTLAGREGCNQTKFHGLPAFDGSPASPDRPLGTRSWFDEFALRDVGWLWVIGEGLPCRWSRICKDLPHPGGDSSLHGVDGAGRNHGHRS